jgi:hypothetical protein
MRRLRGVGVAIAIAGVGSLGLASPAAADGGNTNGYWQYHSTYSTYQECDNAGRPFVPDVADGWACSHWTPSGTTEGWNLYLVFAS